MKIGDGKSNWIELPYFGGSGDAPLADEDTFGLIKLYNSMGSNADGTMTQKAISDELKDKVEISLDTQEELIIIKN